jgi:hypothetical protein
MRRREVIALTVLLLALWGLAAWVRLAHVGAVTTGSDGLGQYMASLAVLRGGAPFVPNPEGGHSLWIWVLPLVAGADSLHGLVQARMVQAALVAPIGALAAWVAVQGEGSVQDPLRFRPAGLAAAACAGTMLALDAGLVDTLEVAFRGYAAPEMLAVATLGGALALNGRVWGLALAAVAMVAATGQHPLATGAILGGVAVLPWLVSSVGWRGVGLAVGLAALASVPRLVHLAALADCGQGAWSCLGAVATGSAETGPTLVSLVERAFHDRVLVEGGWWWAALLVGLALATGVRPSGRSRALVAFALAAALGILLLGLSLHTLRPYHLRIVAAPLAVAGAVGLARAWPLALVAVALAIQAFVAGPKAPSSLQASSSHSSSAADGARERLADQLADTLAEQAGPLRVDGVWFGSPVGLEPAPIVLAAVLQGQEPARFSVAPGVAVLLIVNGPPAADVGSEDVIQRGEGWAMMRFDQPQDAAAWVDAQSPPPIVVGGALDWVKGVHPDPPADWDPGWPPR